jgi:hypothetical protein
MVVVGNQGKFLSLFTTRLVISGNNFHLDILQSPEQVKWLVGPEPEAVINDLYWYVTQSMVRSSVHWTYTVAERLNMRLNLMDSTLVSWLLLVSAMGPGLDQKNGSVRYQTDPKTWPRASWQAKPVPIPVNRRVCPASARPVGFILRFSFSGFSIYGCRQIWYCSVQNINFGTLSSLFLSLAAFMTKTRRDILPAKF